MTVALTYTVLQVLTLALSKLGVPSDTEAKNVEDAFNTMNLMLASWSADPDLAVNRMIPVNGYTSLGDTIDLPGEYTTAIVFNLPILLQSDYDQTLDKTHLEIAGSALANIKTNNVRRQGGKIPTNGVLG